MQPETNKVIERTPGFNNEEMWKQCELLKSVVFQTIQTKSEDLRFDKQLNESIRIFFGDMLMAALTSPSTAKFYVKTLGWQRKAAQKRTRLEAEGLHVPPIMIFSITNRCN